MPPPGTQSAHVIGRVAQRTGVVSGSGARQQHAISSNGSSGGRESGSFQRDVAEAAYSSSGSIHQHQQYQQRLLAWVRVVASNARYSGLPDT